MVTASEHIETEKFICSIFLPLRRNMSDNIQTNTTGRLTPCLQQKIDKTRYLVEVHFSATSTQSVEDKLKRVILHDLEHGKQEIYFQGVCFFQPFIKFAFFLPKQRLLET